MKAVLKNEAKKKEPKGMVMLCIAPWDIWEDEKDLSYPLGLGYLGAVLEKNNYKVSLLNMSFTCYDDVMGEVENNLKKEKPDFFGISILTNSRKSALNILKMAKELSPNTKTIARGVHTTALPHQILENYPVDFIILGEGENTLIELITAVKKKKPVSELRKIKGLGFKHKDEVIITERRERITDLDALPFPKHEFFENILKRTKKAFLMTSRGCPYDCFFCSSSVYGGKYLIQRSAKNVLEEVQFILKEFPYIDSLFFQDDEFICNKSRIIELCKLIIENNIKIRWTCLGRVSSVNEELVYWMKKAGRIEIIFGIESGSQKILDALGKKVKVQEIVDAIRICKKYKIKTSCLTIVGLPRENAKTVKETIDMLKEIRDESEPAILMIFPGTRVYETAKQKGFMGDDYWLTDNLVPLYTCEHSKAKLWWWSFKVGIYSRLYSQPRTIPEFVNRKIIKK